MSRRRKRAAAETAARAVPAPAARQPTPQSFPALIPWVRDWLTAPQPIERLALLRIFLPLAILGFLSSRLVHADYWLTAVGFQVPDLGGDWRQPLYLPPAPSWAAWTLAAVITVSGLCLAAGLASQPAAAIFALGVAYVTLADRLEAFTVTKLAPVLTLALFFAPCGARYAVDGWWRRRRNPGAPIPTHVAGGTIRFFQIFLVTMYSASGIAKARGDWLTQQVLWTHLHDQYQTHVAWLVTHLLPGWSWWALQGLVLTFEAGAPIWFAVRWTRRPALVVGLGMHAMIGLMFGPVVWFALLMATILLASFLPEPLLLRLWSPLRRLSRPTGRNDLTQERAL